MRVILKPPNRDFGADDREAPASWIKRWCGHRSIVHWKFGHFSALVGEANGRYHIEDPTFGHQVCG
jgi:hypothetical protein